MTEHTKFYSFSLELLQIFRDDAYRYEDQLWEFFLHKCEYKNVTCYIH